MNRSRRFLRLALQLPAFATLARAAVLDGQWSAEFDTQVGKQKYVYEFKSDEGGHVTGRAQFERMDQKGEAELRDVKLDGDAVSFAEPLKLPDANIDLSIVYTGKLAGDVLKLTRKVGDFATEELVAKRVEATAHDTAVSVAPAGPAVVPIKITVAPASAGRPLPAEFLGLSFETQRLLPDAEGRHYFRPDNAPLLALFRTLGITCLRIGGNTADRPTIAFPSTEDIDLAFAFARAAKVKVIFTLRLRAGDPRQAAAVAKQIVDHHADVLWCFAIGNEPNVFSPEYAKFLAAWKQFADVVNSPEFAPAARFAGPSSTAGKTAWTRDFAREFAGTGRLLVATQHIYPGGNANLVKDPAEARRLMLSREWVEGYQKFHDGFAPEVLATGTPFRLGETNSFWNGGRADASNTFTAALWALDYLNWWAAHGANGLNFHNGDFVASGETNTRCMYAAFWSTPNGYDVKPVAYALAAFALGGQDGGRTSAAELGDNPQNLNLTAYALRSDNSTTVTLINKESGAAARSADVTLSVRPGTVAQLLRLAAPDGDIARTAGVTLGDAAIAEDGTWSGRWTPTAAASVNGELKIRVTAASAILIRMATP